MAKGVKFCCLLGPEHSSLLNYILINFLFAQDSFTVYAYSPGPYTVHQDDLKLRDLSASRVLRLKLYTTIPGSELFFNFFHNLKT